MEFLQRMQQTYFTSIERHF